MLTDFVTSNIVGGVASYMMGQRVRDLPQRDWGSGAALAEQSYVVGSGPG